MLLYVMRHGPAEDRAPSGRDFDRPLTKAGREVVLRAANQLRMARGVTPEGLGHDGAPIRVLSSPLRRARETAEIVQSVLSADDGAPPPPREVELHDDLAADAGVPLRLVRELAAAGVDVLLVGHQPTVEELVSQLFHPTRFALAGGFRTATIVAAELVAAPDRWRPGAVLDPHRPEP